MMVCVRWHINIPNIELQEVCERIDIVSSDYQWAVLCGHFERESSVSTDPPEHDS